MDLRPHLRDIDGPMWIRPDRQLLARMPSMRPTPAPPAAPTPRKPASAKDKTAAREPQPPLSPEEQKRRGGFHESSYELKTGMDMFESDWPDDVTLPGPLDDDDNDH
jgi:hypothetical protein